MFTTFGARVREARRTSGLSQGELAKLIAHATRQKTTKSLVSQWETGKIANPQNATLIALQRVTGHSAEWLATGKGSKFATIGSKNGSAPAVNVDPIDGLDVETLTRSMRAVLGGAIATPPACKSVAVLYELLRASPGLPEVTLSRMADSLPKA